MTQNEKITCNKQPPQSHLANKYYTPRRWNKTRGEPIKYALCARCNSSVESLCNGDNTHDPMQTREIILTMSLPNLSATPRISSQPNTRIIWLGQDFWTRVSFWMFLFLKAVIPKLSVKSRLVIIPIAQAKLERRRGCTSALTLMPAFLPDTKPSESRVWECLNRAPCKLICQLVINELIQSEIPPPYEKIIRIN